VVCFSFLNWGSELVSCTAVIQLPAFYGFFSGKYHILLARFGFVRTDTGSENPGKYQYSGQKRCRYTSCLAHLSLSPSGDFYRASHYKILLTTFYQTTAKLVAERTIQSVDKFSDWGICWVYTAQAKTVQRRKVLKF
jgi:hypothetical protein